MAQKCEQCGKEGAEHFKKGKFFCDENCEKKYAEDHSKHDKEEKEVCEFC